MKKNLLYSLAAAGVATLGLSVGAIADTAGDPAELLVPVSINPEDGASVKVLNKVTVTLPASTDYEIMPYFDDSKLSQITLKKGDEPAISAKEMGGVEGYAFSILFPSVTEAGTYTLSIPAGFFFEGVWDDAANKTVPAPNGKQSGLITSTIVVDPTVKAPIENYKLLTDPATPVKTLQSVSLVFPDLEYGQLNIDSDVEITFTKKGDATKSVKATANLDFGVSDMSYFGKAVAIEPETEITEAGQWEMNIPAGVCSNNEDGTSSPAIQATYTVDPNAKGPELFYSTSPEDGSSRILPGKPLSVYFTFEDNNEVTLEDDYDISVKFNGKKVNKISEYQLKEGTATGWTNADNWGDNYIELKISRDAFDAAGLLEIYIPEGAYKVDGQDNPEINYTLTLNAVKPDYTPANKSEEKLPAAGVNPKLVIEYLGASEVLDERADPTSELRVTYDGNIIDASRYKVEADWNEVSIEFNNDIFKLPGQLSVYAGEGYFKVDGRKSAAINWSATYGEKKSFTYTASPANNSELDLPDATEGRTEIVFTIPEAQKLSYDEWTDPNHNPIFGSTPKTIKINYGESFTSQQMPNLSQGEDGWIFIPNEGSNKAIISVNNKVFQKGGVLTILVDEGMFTLDDQYGSPAISWSATYGTLAEEKDYEVKLSPSMSLDKQYLLSDFPEFKIEFLNAETAKPKTVKDYDDNNKPITREDVNPHLAIGDVVWYDGYELTEVKDAEHPTFIIKFPGLQEFDASLGGLLNLSIDKGSFILDGEFDSPVISQTWTLKRTKEFNTTITKDPTGDLLNDIDPTTTVEKYESLSDDPAQFHNKQKFMDAYASTLPDDWRENGGMNNGFYPGFACDKEEHLGMDVNFSKMHVVKYNGETLKEDEDYVVTIQQGFKLEFAMVCKRWRSLDLSGTLTIEIEPGALYVSGNPTTEKTIGTWEILKEKNYTFKFTPDPSKPVADLSEVSVTIPEAKTVSVFNKNYINLRSKDYFTFSVAVPDVEVIENAAGTEGVTLKLKFNRVPTEETDYVVSFHYGALYIDNVQPSPSFETVYTLSKESSGVEGIQAGADGKYTVVSIDGRVIFTDGSYDRVKSLDKGIYIINGKKTIIR